VRAGSKKSIAKAAHQVKVRFFILRRWRSFTTRFDRDWKRFAKEPSIEVQKIEISRAVKAKYFWCQCCERANLEDDWELQDYSCPEIGCRGSRQEMINWVHIRELKVEKNYPAIPVKGVRYAL